MKQTLSTVTEQKQSFNVLLSVPHRMDTETSSNIDFVNFEFQLY